MSKKPLEPHNIEAEEALIGSLLVDPDILIEVEHYLRDDSFFIMSHKMMYDAIKSLSDDGQHINLITITDRLKQRDQLDSIGGTPALTKMMSSTPTAMHAQSYAKIVQRDASIRRIMNAAAQITKMAYDSGEDLDDLLEKAESEMIKALAPSKLTTYRSVNEILDEIYKRQEYIHEHGITPGIPTGITDLDKYMGGMHRGDMTVLAARPGMGKTALAIWIAQQVALKQGKKVMVFSLEMSDEQLVNRMIVTHGEMMTTNDLRMGLSNASHDMWQEFYNSIRQLSGAPIYIDDRASLSALEMRQAARRKAIQSGLDLIIVDYLQLMRSGLKYENKVTEVSQISRIVKMTAKELELPILALSQLSRLVERRENNRPVLSDLRDSGAIEQDADQVIFLYRDEVYNPETEHPNIAEVNLAKNRHGPTGMSMVRYEKARQNFMNLVLQTITEEDFYR